MHEKKGEIDFAAKVLQEVHVETYGSLSKREKLDFILEQVRVVLLKKDFVRAYIVSQKVNKKLLEEDNFKDAKVRFYGLMIDYYEEMMDAWELSNCYMQMYKAGLPTGGEDNEGNDVKMEDAGEGEGGEGNLKVRGREEHKRRLERSDPQMSQKIAPTDTITNPRILSSTRRFAPPLTLHYDGIPFCSSLLYLRLPSRSFACHLTDLNRWT